MRTHSFVIEAGFLIRRRIINAITSLAWENGLECTHERAGSSIRFTISGADNTVSALLIAVAKHFD